MENELPPCKEQLNINNSSNHFCFHFTCERRGVDSPSTLCLTGRSECLVSSLWSWSSCSPVERGARLQLMLVILLLACGSSTGRGLLKVCRGPRSASASSTSIALPLCTAEHAARRGSPATCTPCRRERGPQLSGSLSHRWGCLNTESGCCWRPRKRIGPMW